MSNAPTSTETAGARPDDLSREVYCILGAPVDAIEMPTVLRYIETAAKQPEPFLISTPNLNFLVNIQMDPPFREALLASDLSTPDGMPIIWIAWIAGIPIRRRIAGSDIFLALKTAHAPDAPLKVFFFGGPDGIATQACDTLNQERNGLRCVGTHYPGFGTMEEMSSDEVIRTINASRADFLIASLGARKGQLWLLRNHHRLQIPIRAHLGAVVGFQANVIKRAPPIMRRYGLEWLWRIKEEPHLWRRYWNDGTTLLRMLMTRVLPLAIEARIRRFKNARNAQGLLIAHTGDGTARTIKLSGDATSLHVSKALPHFREAVASAQSTIIDLSETRDIDARFLGLLLMLRKGLRQHNAPLAFTGLSFALKRMFHLNGAAFLLSSDDGGDFRR